MCYQKYFWKILVGESHIAESKYGNRMDRDKLIKHKEICEQNWKINGQHTGKGIICNIDPEKISTPLPSCCMLPAVLIFRKYTIKSEAERMLEGSLNGEC